MVSPTTKKRDARINKIKKGPRSTRLGRGAEELRKAGFASKAADEKEIEELRAEMEAQMRNDNTLSNNPAVINELARKEFYRRRGGTTKSKAVVENGDDLFGDLTTHEEEQLEKEYQQSLTQRQTSALEAQEMLREEERLGRMKAKEARFQSRFETFTLAEMPINAIQPDAQVYKEYEEEPTNTEAITASAEYMEPETDVDNVSIQFSSTGN